MKSQLDRIEAMLKAILASDNHIHWVGSYAHGRTSTGDPYIVLFPASDKLEHKICRVYESQFKQLPDFVNTAVPASVRPSKNTPTKNQAIACARFQVITSDGKDTQMGAEKRFFAVLAISSRAPQEAPATVGAVAQPVATQQPQQLTAAELADSFFRRGDKVTVQGKEGTRPGVVTGLGNDGKVAVEVDGVIYRMSPEKLTATDLA